MHLQSSSYVFVSFVALFFDGFFFFRKPKLSLVTHCVSYAPALGGKESLAGECQGSNEPKAMMIKIKDK